MHLIVILFGFLCIALVVVQFVRRKSERRMRVKRFVRAWPAHDEQPAAAHARIVWAEFPHILRLIHAGANLVVFRIIEDEGSRRRAAVFNGEIAVTLEEFETTVPWIPMQSRIVVHRSSGIDAALARQLSGKAHGRDVMLVSSGLPAPVEGPVGNGRRPVQLMG
jgi:hypothetical protein